MIRFASYCTASLLTASLAVVVTTEFPWGVEYELVKNNAVEQRIASQRSFTRTLDTALDALATHDMSLTEASERLASAARKFMPSYLESLSYQESGATETERVARNLAEHFRAINGNSPRSRELEVELERIVRG